MGARRSRRAAGEALAHLERRDRWNGLVAGDLVDIDGVPGRGLSWTFLAHVRNSRNGTESVEVLGGRAGDGHVRSFSPDRVFRAGGRRHGAPSLAEAPQLPLG